MNWTGKLARVFVKNGRLSLLIIITLFIWGIASFYATPKQYNPKITAPSFQIQVDYPGASRSEVLEQVTKPLEHILADIPGVDDIYSVSMRGGSSVVNVNFHVGEDFDSAIIMVDDRIQRNFDLVPLGIAPPKVRSIDPDDVPVMTIALTSEKVDPVGLRKFAFKLRDRLSIIEGTSNIEVVGGRKRELAVILDPLRLAEIKVGLPSIQQALGRGNIFLPSGLIKGDNEFTPLEATSVVRRRSDLENTVVVTGDYGQLYLKDLSRIEERVEEIDSYVRHIAKKGGTVEERDNCVLISIAKMKGTNITSVTERVRSELSSLRNNFIPRSIQAEVLVDEGRTAQREINTLVSNLFTAIFIVVVVLLLALDVRAALLVAISIPLTLASVFGVGFLTGQNINRITLFALILSLGLLVDNATVVIENIVRRMKAEKKKGRIDTVISAVNEVGPGLFMSTVTTVIAFIPMAFVTGMMGPYMGPIPFFVPAALILALVLSLTLNPWMASVVLKPEAEKRSLRLPSAIRNILDRTKELGNKTFESYHRYLHRLLVDRKARRRAMSFIGLLLVVSLMLPAVTLVKFRMLPKADREQFFLYLDLPEGTPLERTFEITRFFEKKLLQEKNVVMTQSYIGRPPILDFNGLFRGVESRRKSSQATIRVGLTNPDHRDTKSAILVQQMRPRLERAAASLTRIKSVKLKLVEDPPGPPVRSTFLVRVQGYDVDLIRQTAKKLLPDLRAIEGVVDTDISIQEETETLQVTVKHERASISRVSPAQIVKTLNTFYSGQIVGIYHNPENIEQEYITIRMDRALRKHPSLLRKLFICNDLGIRVPMKDLIEISSRKTVMPVYRENRLSTEYLYGEMSGRSVTYAAIDFLKHLWNFRPSDGRSERTGFSLFGADYRTPEGKVIKISLGGEWEITLEVFRDLGIAMGIAVFFIYFVLVGQFRSFRLPLIVMSTIPLGLIGVMPGFMILGFTIGLFFNATSMIGVIALAGIAVNNSIILLEYLNSLQHNGMTLEDALIDAGKTRFRPIMLTTITTMLGSLTIVGDPVWAGLAWAIILGLGVSSVLTLIVFPVIYYVVMGRQWDSGDVPE
ncbi:MAG TPA: efflux RND transporter permease subunit [Spirochaetota bacterium]|nr:efflux RND transporter permease subunit [Spirochaetota bacterium]